MLMLLSWLEPSLEEKVKKEEISFKKMLRSSFPKEKLSTSTPAEMSEFWLWETLPTPTVWLLPLMPRISPRKTLLPWLVLITIELFGKLPKKLDALSMMLRRLLFGVTTLLPCSQTSPGPPLREDPFLTLSETNGTPTLSFQECKREVPKLLRLEDILALPALVMPPSLIWGAGSKATPKIGFLSVFGPMETPMVFLKEFSIASLSLLPIRNGQLFLVLRLEQNKELDWTRLPTNCFRKGKPSKAFSKFDFYFLTCAQNQVYYHLKAQNKFLF